MGGLITAMIQLLSLLFMICLRRDHPWQAVRIDPHILEVL